MKATGHSRALFACGVVEDALELQGHCAEVKKKIAMLKKEGIKFVERDIASSAFVVGHAELRHLVQRTLR